MKIVMLPDKEYFDNPYTWARNDNSIVTNERVALRQGWDECVELISAKSIILDIDTLAKEWLLSKLIELAKTNKVLTANNKFSDFIKERLGK